MQVLVIDAQGGGIGRELILRLKKRIPDCKILAVGTNAIATRTMLNAGANQGATGENPVIVATRKADIIVGPIGIIVADALGGEITPKMASAIGAADAKRILIPFDNCGTSIVGVRETNYNRLIEEAIEKIIENYK